MAVQLQSDAALTGSQSCSSWADTDLLHGGREQPLGLQAIVKNLIIHSSNAASEDSAAAEEAFQIDLSLAPGCAG